MADVKCSGCGESLRDVPGEGFFHIRFKPDRKTLDDGEYVCGHFGPRPAVEPTTSQPPEVVGVDVPFIGGKVDTIAAPTQQELRTAIVLCKREMAPASGRHTRRVIRGLEHRIRQLVIELEDLKGELVTVPEAPPTGMIDGPTIEGDE